MLNIYFQDFVWFYLMEDLKTDTRTGARYYIKKDPCPRHGFYLPRGSLQTIFFDGEDFWSPFLESPICNQIHTFYDFDLYHVQGRDHLWGNLCRWQKIVACRCQTTKEHTFQEWEEKQFLLKKKEQFLNVARQSDIIFILHYVKLDLFDCWCTKLFQKKPRSF